MTVGFSEPQRESTWGTTLQSRMESSPMNIVPRLFQTVTFRGVALLLFGLFLVTGPVPDHSDLFAAVLGYSLISLVTLITLFTLTAGWLFRSNAQMRLTYNLGGSATSDRPTSREELDLYVKISNANLLPLLSLRLTPRFEQDCNVLSWKVIGSLENNKEFSQQIRIPHRGYWKITDLEASLRDTFGISQFQWRIQSESFPRIGVYPKESYTRDLPIFTAETTSGIEQSELQRTEGDPYDIKRYHPSDGIRRILWKVYAKSGELLSRHPEPSMTPEGVVALYLLAGKEDDDLCSLSVSFAKTLEERDYEFLLCADGQPNDQLACSSKELEELAITSVWDAELASATERIAGLDRLQSEFSEHRSTTLRRVTFFISLQRLLNHKFYTQIEALFQELSNRQLESLWIVLDDRKDSSDAGNAQSRFTRLLFTPDESHSKKPIESDPEETLAKFTGDCDARNFPYIITV